MAIDSDEGKAGGGGSRYIGGLDLTGSGNIFNSWGTTMLSGMFYAPSQQYYINPVTGSFMFGNKVIDRNAYISGTNKNTGYWSKSVVNKTYAVPDNEATEGFGAVFAEQTEYYYNSTQSDESSLFGDILKGTEKHFNGGLGTVGVAVQGYNNIANDVKRVYAYKLSKMTGIKSGKIFQSAKGFANSTGKLVSKLSPLGTALGVGVIGYEVGTDTWDAHTIVNGSLMVGAGVATFFAAPAVLTGIAIYGVGDYFLDFGGVIDNNLGRNSAVWKP
jgi:hypothetical protein